MMKLMFENNSNLEDVLVEKLEDVLAWAVKIAKLEDDVIEDSFRGTIAAYMDGMYDEYLGLGDMNSKDDDEDEE